MAFYRNKYGELASTFGMPGAQEEAQDKAALAERMATEEQESRERIAQLQAKTQAETQRYGADAPMRLYKQKRDDTPSSWPQGFNKGGAVYKHANPTYAAYAKDGDGSLLAKGRK